MNARALAIAFALTTAATLAVELARAAPSRASARLDLTRGPGAGTCPDAVVLASAVGERLGYRALRDDATDTVRVQFRADTGPARFAADVTLVDANGRATGQRSLEDESDSCDELGRTVALTISVLLENVDLERARTDRAPPAAPTAAPPPAEPVRTAAMEAAREEHVRPRALAAITLTQGLAPSSAVGLGLGLGARLRRVSVDVEARADLPVEATFAEGRVKASQRVVGLVPCFHISFFAGCAVVTVGAQSVEGHGVANARSGDAFVSSAGARIGVEAPLQSGFLFGVSAEGWLALTRTVVAVEPVEIWSSPAAGTTVRVALGYEL